MAQLMLPREELFVPDRYEGLREAGSGALKSIIAPVESTLDVIDNRFANMKAARRGGLMILRGDTGAGKTTFLDTVGLFRKGVVTERIGADTNIAEALEALEETEDARLVVLEGREALGRDSAASLEEGLHAVNAFVRSVSGQQTLVVWPTNTDDLTDLLVEIGGKLGAEALFGTGEPVERFTGPSRDDFVQIAEKTVGVLNDGASLAALGISEERAREMSAEAETIGRYLAMIREALIENDAHVKGLMKEEQYRLWTVVVAGNDPEGDVAALTRGGYAYADIDRLMTATGANVVKELKKFPEQVGILGSVLDARILHLDRVTVLSAARQFGNEQLHALMREAKMSTIADAKAEGRLSGSELGLILAGESLGTRKRGSKAGGGTDAAFASLANIARSNDGAINAAIGEGLKQLELVDSFETERELGTDLKFLSDLYCIQGDTPIRIEVMWRNTTSRAEIANYVLGKLGNYSRAIGLLE